MSAEGAFRLAVLPVRTEQDVVRARRLARELAGGLGFGAVDCTRVATAVSEVARNAYAYAGGGRAELEVRGRALHVQVRDEGPGIPHLEEVLSGHYRSSTGMGLGLLGAHRLMDGVEVRTAPGQGTEVRLKKELPPPVPTPTPAALRALADRVHREPRAEPGAELAAQNHELMVALSALREQQAEMERLNRELEETNRGVVALYAELDEKAEALKRASDLKSRFLSNVSHEFRTPLSSIRGLSRILLARTDGELTAEQERQVGFIAGAADQLCELIEDLLDIAKIESGRTDVHPRRLTVQELLAALRGIVRPLQTNEAVALVMEEEPGLPPLYTDEGKLAQVLRNLLSNALKFTERGEVRLSVRRTPEGLVAFAVSDTGVGIRPEDQGRIFEEFVQVPGPHQKVKGTGLGLPLSRRLAELLGGSLTVQSEPGRGSTFTALVAPVAPDAQDVPPEVRAAWRREARATVVVVDAAAEAGASWGPALVATGLRPEVVPSARAAVRLLARLQPRAVVLPAGEEGAEALLLAAREVPPGVPVLLTHCPPGHPLAAQAASATGGAATAPWLVGVLGHVEASEERPRVLLVDDDEIARYLLRRMLADGPWALEEAAGGEEGLRRVRERPPALVILDLAMPDLTGEEVLAALRAEPATAHVPVIVHTMGPLRPGQEEALRREAHAVLLKQALQREHIQAAVREALADAHREEAHHG